MASFLEAFLGYPTVLFSILLGIALAYWCMVIVGALGIDALDVDADLDGIGDAAGEPPSKGWRGRG